MKIEDINSRCERGFKIDAGGVEWSGVEWMDGEKS